MLSLLFVLACGEEGAGGAEATSSGPEWSEAVEWEVQTLACPASSETNFVKFDLPDPMSIVQLEKCGDVCYPLPVDYSFRDGTELEVRCDPHTELRLLTLSPSD